MTSPRQRKKVAALLKLKKEKQQTEVVPETTTKMAEPVAKPAEAVVESVPVAKPKKSKTALVELKSQDQVVEQVKEEVKNSTGE